MVLTNLYGALSIWKAWSGGSKAMTPIYVWWQHPAHHKKEDFGWSLKQWCDKQVDGGSTEEQGGKTQKGIKEGGVSGEVHAVPRVWMELSMWMAV